MDNPLGDDRFKAMFTNPEFQIDEESEVSHLCVVMYLNNCTVTL